MSCCCEARTTDARSVANALHSLVLGFGAWRFRCRPGKDHLPGPHPCRSSRTTAASATIPTRKRATSISPATTARSRAAVPGQVVMSGNPDSSKLYKSITHAEEPTMPPNKPRLPDKDLEVFQEVDRRRSARELRQQSDRGEQARGRSRLERRRHRKTRRASAHAARVAARSGRPHVARQRAHGARREPVGPARCHRRAEAGAALQHGLTRTDRYHALHRRHARARPVQPQRQAPARRGRTRRQVRQSRRVGHYHRPNA